VNRIQVAWLFGRPAFHALVGMLAPLRIYGSERIPRHGAFILCCNHFSWLDPWAISLGVPRTVFYIAKQEAHDTPVVGPFIRLFGTESIRRGESDREAVRAMREIVRRGDVLGMFPEGTRQQREPGPVLPGAAMIAVQEETPIVCGAIEGTQEWRLGNFHPVSIAYGEPFSLEGLPRNSRGYREGAERIQHEIRMLWEFGVRTQKLGRPRAATPPS
jgi:1-acyl-sn-glycerol-3-phosphate acyltransferase